MSTLPRIEPKVYKCPWCRMVPNVYPLDWKQDGDAIASVGCDNPTCVARPSVAGYDELAEGEGLSGEALSKRCKLVAIARWNSWCHSAFPA